MYRMLMKHINQRILFRNLIFNMLRDQFEKLPESDKDKIFSLIYEAMLWREWDKIRNSPTSYGKYSMNCIYGIVDVFAENNIHFEAYT